MKVFKCFGLMVALVLCLAAGSSVQADQGRQYYSKYWQRNGGYYYRNYYYKPTPDAKYRSHLVIYYPSQPRYYYYYNQYTKKYWGRYDRVVQGYSKLAPADQREKLTDIAEDAFPKAGIMPALPESEDGTAMEKPPDNLPPDESATLSQQKVKSMLPRVEDKEPPRQVYSDWCKHGGYYYCCYYCQPKAGGEYISHRCVYYPSKPQYIYYYNPVKKKYWGRYDLEAKGYSLLPEDQRREKLADISEDAFPKPGEMPLVPGSEDNTRMALPPKELPE